MAYLRQARWVAKPGQAPAVAAALLAMIEPSRAEHGCMYYQPSRSTDDDHVFHMVEVFTNEEAFTAHCATEHVRVHVVESALPRLLERTFSVSETLDGSDQGRPIPASSSPTPTKGLQR